MDEAEKYYRQALSSDPVNPVLMDNLAYFLINADRNVNEGLNLADKALEKEPDNFWLLHTKGWGFYKLGKFQESVDLLQRSWELRRQYARYNHDAFLHLEAAKKAVAGQKND